MADVLLGTRLGSYRIDALIGTGGMSRVYRAEHLTLQRSVALKVLAPALTGDANYRDRFLHESRLAASIEHPNILPIYDAGESEGYLFIAMRLVDGTDLRKLLDRDGATSPERALSFLAQAALALDAAHARGLIHRDVKPANLLLAGEHVFLTDFGIAKMVGDIRGATRIGIFVGTIDYASPEQILQEPLDARSDLYSLACVFYQCLTGKAPFDKPTDHAIVEAHLSEPPPSILADRPEMPSALDTVFATALAKNPEARYRSGRFLADAARLAFEGPAQAIRPARPTIIDSSPQTPWPRAEATPLMEQAATSVDRPERSRSLGLIIGGLAVAGFIYVYGAFAGLFPVLPGLTQVVAASASPSATSTLTFRPTPTPAPTHPYVVALSASQMIMPSSQLAQSGVTVTRDEAWGGSGWLREFNTSEFYYLRFYVYVWSPSVTATSDVATRTCDFHFDPPQPQASEVKAEVIGDGAKACLYHWNVNLVDWYEYIVATRNVTIIVAGEPRLISAQATAMSRMVQFARQQIGIIDLMAPR